MTLRLSLTFLATAMLGLVLAGQPQAARADRFKSEPIEYNSTMPVEFGVPFFFATVDEESEPTPFMSIGFAYHQPGGRYGDSTWKYASCHTLDWLVDGQPLKLGDSRHSQWDFSGRMTELISQRVTLSQLRTLAAARSIEYRICKDEHVLPDEDIEGLREFAEQAARVPGIAGP